MLCLDFPSPFSKSSIFCKQRIWRMWRRVTEQTLTLRDSSNHSHTIFWKTCRTPESFLSFTFSELYRDHSLPPLPAAHLHPKSLCGPLSRWQQLASHACCKKRKKAWTLLCKCRKRVRQRVQVKCRFAEQEERNVSVQTPLRCSGLNMCTAAPTWKQLIQNIVGGGGGQNYGRIPEYLCVHVNTLPTVNQEGRT